jgi:hypothetical protein
MANIECKSPLIWPDRIPETEPHLRSMPSTGVTPNLTFQQALEFLTTEAFVFPADHMVLNTNYESTHEGGLRKKSGTSPGASLHFAYDGNQYLIPCDRWNTTPHNIYALHLMLRNIMQNMKWGFSPLNVLLHGYMAHIMESSLAAAGPVTNNAWWMQFLGLGPTARVGDANAVYRSRAKEIGQDEEKLLKLNEAISLARQHLR